MSSVQFRGRSNNSVVSGHRCGRRRQVLKEPGIGRTLTILVDATLIGVVLLPVTMRLVGREPVASRGRGAGRSGGSGPRRARGAYFAGSTCDRLGRVTPRAVCGV
ncbi:hypothetical protein ACFS5L_18050 [Streptomyces phyllanthi]|uniref:Uncharacterized protein n=1 Tax=Streptomyces phyllanthi TaxID=1803180 RepID=A0A5N8WB04_9ACTN|nr:hypothetical protein [Streptomyces phyllanthi]MPY44489.1 hypothetical protein [Streptomyces phyllanthi]